MRETEQLIIDLLLLSLYLTLHLPRLLEQFLSALILCRIFLMFLKHDFACSSNLLQVFSPLNLFLCVFKVGIFCDLPLEGAHDHWFLMTVKVLLEISCERVLFRTKMSLYQLFVRFKLLISTCSGFFDLDFQEESSFFSIFCLLLLLVLNVHQVWVMGLQLVFSVLLLLLFLG